MSSSRRRGRSDDDDTGEAGRSKKRLRLLSIEDLATNMASLAESSKALESELERIKSVHDPLLLFGVQACDPSTEEYLSTATATKNRLLRMSHPDRGREQGHALWTLRNAAAAHINNLWSKFKSTLGRKQEAETHEVQPEGRNLCLGIVRTGGEGAGSSVKVLQVMAALGKLLFNSELNTYIGFGEYLSMHGCYFEPLGTNRAVNQDVVARRVANNISSLAQTGIYCDFGSISLCVVEGDDVAENGSAKFYVLDGQHRLGVMRDLKRLNPGTQIHFKLSCKVVPSHAKATEELRAMQDCYPADARCFFDTRDENVLASHLLDFARIRWPLLFRDDTRAGDSWQDRRGALRVDPARPCLNDGIFFDLLRDTGVLAAALWMYRSTGAPHGGDFGLCAASGIDRLQTISDAIAGLYDRELVSFGAKDTWRRCNDAQRGCLGMYKRDDKGQEVLQLLSDDGLIFQAPHSHPHPSCPAAAAGGGAATQVVGVARAGGSTAEMRIGFPIGARVRIQGLVSRGELNGQVGMYEGPAPGDSSRCQVVLHCGRHISVPANNVAASGDLVS